MFFKRLVIKNFRNFRGVNTICLRTMNVLKTGNKVAAWQLIDALRFVLGYPNAIPFVPWEDLPVSGNETISVSLTYAPQVGQVRNLRRMIRDKVMRYYHNEVEVTLQEYYAVVTSFGLDKPFFFEDELFDIAVKEPNGIEKIISFKQGRPAYANLLECERETLKQCHQVIQELLQQNEEAWDKLEKNEMAQGQSSRRDDSQRPDLPPALQASSAAPSHSGIDEDSDSPTSSPPRLHSAVRILIATPTFLSTVHTPENFNAEVANEPLEIAEENMLDEGRVNGIENNDDEGRVNGIENGESSSSEGTEDSSQDSESSMIRNSPSTLLEETAELLPIACDEEDFVIEQECTDQFNAIRNEILWRLFELSNLTNRNSVMVRIRLDIIKLNQLILKRQERIINLEQFLQTQNTQIVHLKDIFDCKSVKVFPRFTAHGSLVDHLAKMPQDIWAVVFYLLSDVLWKPILDNLTEKRNLELEIRQIRDSCDFEFLVLNDYPGLKEFLYEHESGIPVNNLDDVQRLLLNLKSFGIIENFPHFLRQIYIEGVTEPMLDTIFMENPEIDTIISANGNVWERCGIRREIPIPALLEQGHPSQSLEELTEQLNRLYLFKEIGDCFIQIWNEQIRIYRTEQSTLERALEMIQANDWQIVNGRPEFDPDVEPETPEVIAETIARMEAELKETRHTLFSLVEARFLSYIQHTDFLPPNLLRELLDQLKQEPIDRSEASSRRNQFHTETVMSPAPSQSDEFKYSSTLLPEIEMKIKEERKKAKESKRKIRRLAEIRWSYLTQHVSQFSNEMFCLIADMLGDEYALVDENGSLRFMKLSKTTPGEMNPVDLQRQPKFVQAILVLGAFLALNVTSGPVAIVSGIDSYLPDYFEMPWTRSGMVQKIFPAMRRALLNIMERCHDSPEDYSKFLKQVILISDDVDLSPTTESIIAVTTDTIFDPERDSNQDVVSMKSEAVESGCYRFSRRATQ